ncbi:MAG: hypothetical protein A2600_09400 [Candidatus Lambdaproteobacteria bacterium RIFOXYD1_FULL_56_27]|uniref:DNA binding HTH domain-containing protein n=1 Tax=Candidatus Lambdaproteobacteria bacterium RIFOXYD2_FULL_56_26 TaxID=1817773 RepID=A0A1F6GUV1_9PROT|nr:MAG: hypothetical protein A2557_04670 [Candidatus Lambdaproteobacteria bacterium RIFOXYD2_FULL_56_26]OGH02267.1 MAG: hypothetical protein A2426_03150 [Candidatus Lambdaproteobacteria bacterium RIFOXYC1_FULL_56_13]OGH10036.1 MAG: hypothetical protein A2600_09400 [Candidatus Lambdaproteobacteria bacterium RIFOXYD1_FULL_56_27]
MNAASYHEPILLIRSRNSSTDPLKEGLGEQLFSLLWEVSEKGAELENSQGPVLVYPSDSGLINRLSKTYPGRILICAALRSPRKKLPRHCLVFQLPGHAPFLAHLIRLASLLLQANARSQRLLTQQAPASKNGGVVLSDLNLKAGRVALIQEAMTRTNNNHTKAARLLGISRQALSQDLHRNFLSPVAKPTAKKSKRAKSGLQGPKPLNNT